MVDFSLILTIAVLLDIIFGEPSNRYHPVAWLGKLITVEVGLAPKQGKWRQLIYGGAMVVATVALSGVLCYFLLVQFTSLSRLAYILVASLMLKFSFSWRGLIRATEEVRKLLIGEDITQARQKLQSLVSRDTTNLDKESIISATVESAAENMCDSFTAPLFYFLLFGVPGAVAYRVVNTFDAMIGYHGRWEYLGKIAARMDDVANYIPARLTGLTIVLAAYLCRSSAAEAWHIMLRDHSKTESPNSGWTMSAVAGALQVQLEKQQSYRLGDSRRQLTPDAIVVSQKIAAVTAAIWVLLIIVVKGAWVATAA